jgi:hypothetical protein
MTKPLIGPSKLGHKLTLAIMVSHLLYIKKDIIGILKFVYSVKVLAMDTAFASNLSVTKLIVMTDISL